MNKLVALLVVVICQNTLSNVIGDNFIILGDKNSLNNPFEACDQWTHELSVVNLSENQYLTNTQSGISCSKTTQSFDINIGTVIEFSFFAKFSNNENSGGVLIEIVNGDGIEIWHKFIHESTEGWNFYSQQFYRIYKNARVRI